MSEMNNTSTTQLSDAQGALGMGLSSILMVPNLSSSCI